MHSGSEKEVRNKMGQLPEEPAGVGWVGKVSEEVRFEYLDEVREPAV